MEATFSMHGCHARINRVAPELSVRVSDWGLKVRAKTLGPFDQYFTTETALCTRSMEAPPWPP